MAFLMMSAAVPCIGALIAARSAALRRIALREVISGKCKRRPKMVST
ncbi:Uncharacterised protein [Vibrio cholerae]|nr:Uncharacterised protein [Vibrio cholerae]CSD10652.1 Uncharacterised protein [Vibrio cholerae]CSD84809.1 Uncharacterised protein [Vibrio cholerae]